MKNIVIVILLAAAVALGALCVVQHNKLQSQTAQLAQTESRLTAVENQLKEKSEAIENAALAESKARILQKTLTETSAAAVEKSKQVEALEQSLATAKTNSDSPLAGMFKDPKMRDLIKSQQKAFMGPMIDKNYAALFQQLNLSPEQSAHVKDLLQQKMLASADMGMSMLDGSLDAAKRAELGKQIKEQSDSFDAQIKDYLGSDNQQAFETYEKGIPDRMALGQFRDQLAGTETALTPAQEQQLIQAMTVERTNFKWTTDFSNPNPGAANYADMFSEEHLAKFAEEKAQFDQQFLAKAGQMLTPDQLKSFTQFQINQRDMQINGMKMAAQMFAPKK